MDGSDALKEISRKMPTHISTWFRKDLESLKCADLAITTAFRKQLLGNERVKTIVTLCL